MLTAGSFPGIKAKGTVLVIVICFFFSSLSGFLSSLTVEISPFAAETIQKIRERTRLAMQSPKVMSCKSFICGLFSNLDSLDWFPTFGGSFLVSEC